MLDIKFIRENPDAVKDAAKKKAMEVNVDRILELDKERRDTLQVVEKLRAEQNKASHTISSEKDDRKKKGLISEMRDVKKNLQESEGTLEKAEEELNDLLKLVPNIPYDDVPVGPDASANVVLREVGKKPKFSFDANDYLTIAETHDWIDIERAAKVSGSRFGYIKGDLALLEFAIVRYAMDFLTKERFTPVLPPVLVKPEYMEAMGFLHGEAADDAYYLEKDELYLAGTSEQVIGPMHAGETFKGEDLPKRYVGFSTCFRREAGSYGRDTKGILRVHQFDKVEMVVFAHPEKSREELTYLLSLNEKMMQELKLPYRVVHISTGDMGLAKADMYDIETWIPSENTYRETHSASNITDFQARRLNIKFGKDRQYVHMLNGTVFAIGRTLIAIIENYQTKDGEVDIPKALQGYMRKKKLKNAPSKK
jgi:seryl-tRNA synthetase